MPASPQSAAPSPVVAGDVVAGKYRILQQLGAGGMGLVFLATHITLNQRVALKLLTADPRDESATDRFAREARIAAELTCEQVPRVVDFGSLPDGTSFMVMEFLEGVDLDQFLAARGTLPVSEAVDLVLQACVAVAEAHARGVVHRDIKPSNLFLTERPDGSQLVKVLDFGISKRTLPGAEIRLTTTGSSLGSPLYMSPEQCRDSKTVDERTDIWSLGTVVYELVTGHAPFEGASIHESVAKIAADPVPPMRSFGVGVPAPFEAVLLKCLAKRREERFQTVAELASALVPFASPAAAQAYVPRVWGSLERATSPSTKRPAIVPPTDSVRTAAAWQTTMGTASRRRFGIAALAGVAVAVVVLVVVGFGFGRKFALRRASAPASAVAAAPPPPATVDVAPPPPAPTTAPSASAMPSPAPSHPVVRPAKALPPRKSADPKAPPGLDNPSLLSR